MNGKMAHSERGKGKQNRIISNPKERKRIQFTLLLTLVLSSLCVFVIDFISINVVPLDSEGYEEIIELVGSAARIGFFAALVIYPIFLLLKWDRIKRWKWRQWEAKAFLRIVAVQIRQWHVPIAIVSIALVLLHGYISLLQGVEFNFRYISGLLAAAVMLVIPITGLKRYKRQDKKWHFKIAVVFFVLFMLHASLG
ncbi:MAG: hypothetical protein ACE3JP_15335 [Ectobacillus sp.]